jgi:hypothetical protein
MVCIGLPGCAAARSRKPGATVIEVSWQIVPGALETVRVGGVRIPARIAAARIQRAAAGQREPTSGAGGKPCREDAT